MRDQWRAEDDNRDSARRRDRGASDRRNISPAAPRPQRDTDVGLKIKGRAAADSAPVSPSRKEKLERESSKKDVLRKSSRSPQRSRLREEERARRPRDTSRDRRPERPRRRDEPDTVNTRRRSRSRSPAREIFDFRDERRRPRSPIYSGRSDKFRPNSRRRERARSPPRSSRGDYYSASYPEPSSLAGRFGDSYVPGSWRRPSPPARPAARRRSRSRDRRPRSRRASPAPIRRAKSSDRTSRRGRDAAVPNQFLAPRSGKSPTTHEKPTRHRDSSRSRSRVTSKGPTGRKRSPSRVDQKGKRGGRTKMQSSTRPIQSILNDGSRPPSPPRRIPSFDSGTSNPNTITHQFPLHGMKASDVQHRGNRPPQLNTQHSYSASPQWTPTSSHHGSPHSASSFNPGRAGWNGQQQQYQGQQGYVLSINSMYDTLIRFKHDFILSTVSAKQLSASAKPTVLHQLPAKSICWPTTDPTWLPKST